MASPPAAPVSRNPVGPSGMPAGPALASRQTPIGPFRSKATSAFTPTSFKVPPTRPAKNKPGGRPPTAASPRWGTAAAFGDVDGDGDLDLHVVNYVEFDPKAERCSQTGEPNIAFRGTPK